VDVKDLTVSFVKRGRAIACTLNNLEIPPLTYRGHCIGGTAAPRTNDYTHSHVLHWKEEEKEE